MPAFRLQRRRQAVLDKKGIGEQVKVSPELASAIGQIEKVIVGKRGVIEKIFMALLCDGHILLDDIPGVGKTTLALALSRATGLKYRRIQFTPDVLPSDIVGFSMYDKDTGGFYYRPGALTGANLVLGDEINRASSRTQSALLEAMEERQVTVDGSAHPMEKPFCVIATQNSVGAVGTQPLPYAQLDRFLICTTIGYPDHDAQIAMLRDRQQGDPMDGVDNVLSTDRITEMQREAALVTVKDSILDYISRLAIASREHHMTELGISPRGAIYISRMAKAHAYIDGRDYVTGGDVQAVFGDVCAHRILLRQDAFVTPREVLDELLRTVKSPDHRTLR